MKSPKPSDFTIREVQLAEALEITPQRLDAIIDFFDSDPDDEWELKENDHFIFLDKTWKKRLFSQQGAFAVAKYMDSIEKKTIWSRLIEFVTRHKEKIRNAFVRQKVQENCSSLTLRNNRHFLSKADVLRILCTSPARLNKAFEDIKTSTHPMELDVDFTEIEGVRYYSLSGLDKLSRELSTKLKDKDRRAWCAAVEVVGSKTLKLLIDEQEARLQKIESAKTKAKTRDGKACRITGAKAEKYRQINLAAHHIYCQKYYPHLAATVDNIITVSEEIHKEFHNWNGGFDKPCTIDDFIRFVNEQYPENEKVNIWLNQQKKVLGEQKAA